jgi:Kelch motif
LLPLAACTNAEPPPSTPPPSVNAPLSWQHLADAPTARTEVAAAAAGGRIAVVGGYLADGATAARVELFDPATGRWDQGPDLPVAVNHAMAATVSDSVYVFGGYLLAGDQPSVGAYRLEPGGWRAVAAMPEARAAGTAVAIGGSVYIAGGIMPGRRLAESMLVYDPAADRWSTAPGPPTPREHLGGAGFGGLVYTVGGRAEGVGNLGAFEAYDPGTRQWQRLPDLPTRRGGLAATATCSGNIVAIGGEAAETFAEVESYDVPAGVWRRLPDLPTPRHGLGVVAIGTIVYTLSGGPHPGVHVASATEALDLAELGPCL